MPKYFRYGGPFQKCCAGEVTHVYLSWSKPWSL